MEGKGSSLSVTLDRGLLRFLLVAAIVIFPVYAIYTGIRPQADVITQTFFQMDNPEEQSITLNVHQNGEIDVNGQLIKETALRILNADEVRLLVIDSSMEYLSDVTIYLNLPAALKTGPQNYQILPIHGATAEKPELIDSSHLVFKLHNVEPGASVSLVAQMPRGSLTLSFRSWINSLATSTPLWWWWTVGIFWPVIIGILFITVVTFRKRLVAVFGHIERPPSNLSPAAAGLLVEERIGQRQLAATLVQLAVEGEVELVQTRKGYKIARKRELSHQTLPEKFLIDELRIKLAPITHQDWVEEETQRQLFSRRITEAYLSIYHELEYRGFFRPQSASSITFRFLGLIMILLGLAGTIAVSFLLLEGTKLIPATAGLFAAGWLVLALAPHLPRLTHLGEAERSRWMAFRAYLAEETPIHGSQQTASQFEKYLPYAISFGVAEAWLRRFPREFVKIPDWYFNEDNPGSSEIFAEEVVKISDRVSHTLTTIALPHT